MNEQSAQRNHESASWISILQYSAGPYIRYIVTIRYRFPIESIPVALAATVDGDNSGGGDRRAGVGIDRGTGLMSTTAIFLAIFTVVGMSAGQLLFKLAAGRGSVEQILTSPYLWVAGGLYAVVTIAWVLLLREIDLARAYPLIAACYVLVPIGSALVFGERIGVLYGVGVLLIVAGIFITVRA